MARNRRFRSRGRNGRRSRRKLSRFITIPRGGVRM